MTQYFIALFLLVVLSIVYYKLADKYNIVDKPNQRSSHSVITIRGGGILFSLAILLFSFCNDFQYIYFVSGILIVSVISFLDDIITLSPKIRFPFHFLGICLVLLEVSLPTSPVYIFLLTLFIGIGVINMFNFMDGVNGITGIYSLSVLIGMSMINRSENLVNSDLLIYVAISLLIFGFYNFRKKALFFAGDIGSISIGMLVFYLGLLFFVKLNAPVVILLILVYGADTGMTILYKKLYTKESVFEAHRHHIYQKIVDNYKMSHIKISLIYGVIQLIVNFIVLNSYKLSLEKQWLIVSLFVIVFGSIYILLFKLLKNKTSNQ